MVRTRRKTVLWKAGEPKVKRDEGKQTPYVSGTMLAHSAKTMTRASCNWWWAKIERVAE
jgi:hypothetical protein